MNAYVAAAVLAGAAVALPHTASAQKEAMGMMYEIQMSPKVCGWTGTGDTKKLDATVAAQEQALGVTASDRATLMKAAEADLTSDPSNCAKDGMMRARYDEAVK